VRRLRVKVPLPAPVGVHDVGAAFLGPFEVWDEGRPKPVRFLPSSCFTPNEILPPTNLSTSSGAMTRSSAPAVVSYRFGIRCAKKSTSSEAAGGSRLLRLTTA
jgi:hypothetical protein